MAVLLKGDINALCEQAVKGFVVGNEFRGTQSFYLLDCVLANIRRNRRVDPADRCLQPLQEQYILKGFPFRGLAVRGDGRGVDVLAAGLFKQFDGDRLPIR